MASMGTDKEALLLLCVIALAAGGEKNIKNLVSKAKTLADELGEEDDNSHDDDIQADDDSDSEDDDSSAEDEDEDSDSDSDEEDGNDEAEEDDEDEKPVKQAAKGKKAGAPKKNFKKKPQSYARDNDTHKELFSGVLKAIKPDWKKDAAAKKRAKDVSVKMEGEDFLDAEGNVLASFKQAAKKLMLAKK